MVHSRQGSDTWGLNVFFRFCSKVILSFCNPQFPRYLLPLVDLMQDPRCVSPKRINVDIDQDPFDPWAGESPATDREHRRRDAHGGGWVAAGCHQRRAGGHAKAEEKLWKRKPCYALLQEHDSTLRSHTRGGRRSPVSLARPRGNTSTLLRSSTSLMCCGQIF